MKRTDTGEYLLPIIEIFKKEFRAFFHSYLAWAILFLTSTINGLFGWWTIHQEAGSQLSLQLIFYRFSGTVMVASALIGMKLFSEEKALGTMELLVTAPIRESQIALGKFFSAILFLIAVILCSIPIPLMVVFYGDGHWGHIFSGYIGVFFIGAASVSISLFYSTLTKVQLMAALMAIGNICLFLLLGFFSPYVSQPMTKILREFSLYIHYRDFEKGVLVLRHFVYFLSIITFYFYLTIISLQSRRWQ